MANLATGNKRAPHSERGDDLYETPPEAVYALLKAEDVPEHVWEPACGPGAIVRVLRDEGHTVYASDLVDYESPDQDEARADFLMAGFDYAEAIVTNPPFKIANEFVAHALDLCPRVYMLLRLAFLESERRTDILENRGLKRVHVFRKRLPMMHRAEWVGKKGNSAMAFAWFYWERGYQGYPELRRLSW